MSKRTLLTLSFTLVLLLAPAGAVSASAPSAPTAAPCGPASTYDPACDVNHDGVINVVDVQLTADKWNQSGTWFGDNGHDHLGQAWTGNDNPLTVSGTYSYPSAPLVLNNTSGNGLLVNEASAVGVYVQQAGNINPSVSPSLPGTGFEVLGAERVGLQVGQAGVDGVFINSAGRSGVTVNTSEANGLEVRGAQGNGLYVDQAGQNGVHVNSATGNGLYVGQASDSGVYVDAASSNGLYVGSSGLDGVHVGSSDTDGVKVVSAGSPSAMNFDFRCGYPARSAADGIGRGWSCPQFEDGGGGGRPASGGCAQHRHRPGST